MYKTLEPFFFRWHGYPNGGYPGMTNWYGVSWHFSIPTILISVLAVLGIIVCLRWLMVSSRRGQSAFHADSPLDILKKRYARGELTRDEYQNMKRDIGA
ncbi:MAG: SHOCT domain-containing protein [Hyphomicrobiales bacterium]